MIHTSRQLKDLIRNLAKSTGIEAHVLIRRYMMERLLERISLSPYHDSFILKGGMLVSSLVGVNIRATMDMDTTVRGLPVTVADMERIINEILSIPLEDAVQFRIRSISNIMDEMEYSGIRVSLEALLDNSITPLKLDISTGDVITPQEIQYPYKLMFEDRNIPLMAYPLETVLAEKLETVLSRSTLNSRMRDYYDIHILYETYSQELDNNTLTKALTATAGKRGTLNQLQDTDLILNAIEESAELQQLWKEYQQKNKYAAYISWENVVASTRKLSAAANLLVNSLI